MKNNDWDVIVVGGGPAGCTAASYLARDGRKVILLEKDKHPRHRIGESLLPSLMPILEDFGLLEECERRKFPRKPGATYTWGKADKPWHLKWKENPFLPYTYAYHVERASFDEMLSQYARSVGVDVREETKVTEPIFVPGTKRLAGVKWKDKNGMTGELRAKFVIDASGSASVVAKQLSTRIFDDQMRQVAFYSYFDNVVGPDEAEVEGIEGHIVITTCAKGWFWWIPIASKNIGYVSCGLVSGQEFKDQFNSGAGGPEKFFWQAVEETPRVKKMLGPNAKQTQPFRTVMDWSYTCDITAGPGYFACGDAAAFLDPLISTGVSLAMLSAYSAAICVNTIVTNPSKEADVINFYQRNYKQMYEVTRDFLHYFYSGATTMHAEELFWKGKRNLRVGDNIGAKQAFTYFTAVIPGNPHPAIGKQVSFFKNMMTSVDLPKEKLEKEIKIKAEWENVKEVDFPEVGSQTRLLVNGTYEKSFFIDGKKRELVETWGISYDAERPVLSNTASWLMGQNFLAVSQEQKQVLQFLDGKKTWRQVCEEVRKENKEIKFDEVLKKLCDERLVLKRVG